MFLEDEFGDYDYDDEKSTYFIDTGTLWTTADGTDIDVGRMPDSHLCNTIAYLERKDAIRRENIGYGSLRYNKFMSAMKMEAARRKELRNFALQPLTSLTGSGMTESELRKALNLRKLIAHIDENG